MSAWARWYERHWRDWRPAAYRPGATLALVRRNLAACDGEAQDGRLLLRTKELSLEVRERVQAHLFMHIVSTEFSLFVAAPGGPPASLELRHAGCLRRRGILCKVRSGSGLEPLREALQGGDRVLLEQLMPLDFRSLRLCRDDRGWTVSLEHLGRARWSTASPPIAATSLWSPSSAWPCWAPSPNCSACFLPPERPLPALPDAYPPVHLR